MSRKRYHLRQNTIIKASAGTGKTHALVEAIIHLLAGLTHWERPIEPQKIVAITFTEKAAGEMLDRIRKRIDQLAAGDSQTEELLAQSSIHLGQPLPDRNHWREVRQQVDQLTATTFHSFCLSLLQRFPLEAGLDPAFQVYDEAVTGARLEEMAELEILAALQEDRAGRMEALVQTVGMHRRHEFGSPGLVELLPALLRSIGESGLELADIDRLTSEPAGGATDRETELARAVSELLERLDRRFTREKRRAGQIDFLDMQRLVRSLLKDHHQIRREVKNRIGVLLVDEFQDTNPIQRDLVLLLAEPVDQEFDWSRIDRQRSLPEGYRLGHRRLFVVGDPKQSIYDFRGADVSIFTWMESLIHHSGGECDSLQISYRSRPSLLEASNRLFAELLQPWPGEMEPWFIHWSQDAALLPHRPDPIPAPALHLLDSEAWCRIRSEEAGRSRPVRLDQRREFGAVAELIMAMVQGDNPWQVVDTEYDSRSSVVRPARFSDITILLRRFVNALPELLYQLEQRSIPTYVVRGGGFYAAQEVIDLAVALRALSASGDATSLAAWLRGPMVGLSDDALATLAMVLGSIDRQALIRLAFDTDDPSAARVASTPGGRPGGDLLAQLTPADRRALVNASRLVAELDRAGETIGPATCLSLLLEHTDYLEVLAGMPYPEQPLAHIWRVKDLAEQYQRTTAGGLTGFAGLLTRMVQWEPTLDTAQIVEELTDVVRIMTIHQSKGLDCAIAIIAEADNTIASPRDKVLFSPRTGLGIKIDPQEKETLEQVAPRYTVIAEEHRSRQLAERRRLMYVAFTRARDHVVLSGNTPLERSPGDRSQPPRFQLARYQPDKPGWMEVTQDLKNRGERWFHTIAAEEFLDRITTARPITAAPPTDSLEAVLERVEASRDAFGGRLVISVTAMGDYAVCPRRYWYRWEVGLDTARPGVPDMEEEIPAEEETMADPDWPVHPTDLGTLAHSLLESVDIGRYRSRDPKARRAYLWQLARGAGFGSGPEPMEPVLDAVTRTLAGKVGDLLATREAVEREVGFFLHVPCGRDLDGDHLFLRGRIDLIVLPSAGNPGEVLDYKYAVHPRRSVDVLAIPTDPLVPSMGRPELDRHTFQLQAYTLALHRRLGSPEDGRYRSGIVFIREHDPMPSYLPEELCSSDLERVGRRLAGLGTRLIHSRQADFWPRRSHDETIGSGCRVSCPFTTICRSRARV